MNIELLINQAEEKAIREYDGHITLMRFTSGWKVVKGTPELRSGEGDYEVSQLQSFKTLEEALLDYLK